MPKTVSQGFEEFMSNLTPLSFEQTAATRHRAGVETSIKNALGVTLFRETGSFHHGTGVRHHADLDILVSLAGLRPTSSDTALGWIKTALQNSYPTTPVRISRPAVVVEFANGEETVEVIPGYYTGGGDPADFLYVYSIPGAASGWMESAPKAHLNYVNECNTKDGIKGGTKKLARLAKAWKYYNNVPTSSFYLEMRAAQYMATQTSYNPTQDLCYFLEDLWRHQLASMNDPKGYSSRFNACSSDYRKADALSRLNSGATRARKAVDAYLSEDSFTAFYYLNLLFGGNFPAR